MNSSLVSFKNSNCVIDKYYHHTILSACLQFLGRCSASKDIGFSATPNERNFKIFQQSEWSQGNVPTFSSFDFPKW